MAKQTIEQYTCDGARGNACGKVLAHPGDGLVIRGTVHTIGTEAPAVGPAPGLRNGASEETALCWACWHARVTDPLYDAERHKPPRVEYRTEYVYERPGNGPSGPLPPPELPRAVGVAAALCGVRSR